MVTDPADACGAPRVREARGLRFSLYEWGAPGRSPVLLLHSLAAHSHWFDWTAPPLGRRRHVLALDLRGHGGSAWTEPAAYAFDDYLGDIVAVLDALGWRAPAVIGHSMGGYLGALLAARHPERVAALVIADMLTGWGDAQARRAKEQAGRAAPVFSSPAEAAARFRLAPPRRGRRARGSRISAPRGWSSGAPAGGSTP